MDQLDDNDLLNPNLGNRMVDGWKGYTERQEMLINAVGNTQKLRQKLNSITESTIASQVNETYATKTEAQQAIIAPALGKALLHGELESVKAIMEASPYAKDITFRIDASGPMPFEEDIIASPVEVVEKFKEKFDIPGSGPLTNYLNEINRGTNTKPKNPSEEKKSPNRYEVAGSNASHPERPSEIRRSNMFDGLRNLASRTAGNNKGGPGRG